MLRFILRNIHLNLPLNMFHIWTLLQSYQLMMMKWNNSCNSSIQIIVMIFCILTSICFSLYKWLLLIQNSIHSLMCCFINIEEKILMSQIACHTFLCSYQTSPMWICLMEKRDMPKELGLFYVIFLTVPLYIRWDQFFIVQVTLPTPSYSMPSNFILFSKRLHLNPLNIAILLTLRVVLWDHPTRLKTI